MKLDDVDEAVATAHEDVRQGLGHVGLSRAGRAVEHRLPFPLNGLMPHGECCEVESRVRCALL